MTTLIDPLIGNRGPAEDVVGFGPISRACRLLMNDRLNDELDRVGERWHAADLALDEAGLDPGVGQIEIEHVAAGNLFEGSHPSLIEAPVSRYPNVSMMAYAVTPASAQFDIDQLDTFTFTLFIEPIVIVRDVAEDQEIAAGTILHRRIERTVEAIHSVIKGDPTLLGTVNPGDRRPRGGILPARWIKTDKETGQRHKIQLARLQYTLNRDAKF